MLLIECRSRELPKGMINLMLVAEGDKGKPMLSLVEKRFSMWKIILRTRGQLRVPPTISQLCAPTMFSISAAKEVVKKIKAFNGLP
jgi:hypothetical protein